MNAEGEVGYSSTLSITSSKFYSLGLQTYFDTKFVVIYLHFMKLSSYTDVVH